jgi:hypothetical protein
MSTKAIVLASGGTTANTSGSRTGLPLDHVGIVNNGESGVYLGNFHGKSWVLTANHSGPGSFKLGGITYHAVAGSTHQLVNPDSTPSDIVLFQIDSDPGLPPLNLAPTSPTSVFIRQENQWQLIGMLDALSGLANQPAGTSIFNGNINVIADLSQYRPQIDAIVLPDRTRHP